MDARLTVDEMNHFTEKKFLRRELRYLIKENYYFWNIFVFYDWRKNWPYNLSRTVSVGNGGRQAPRKGKKNNVAVRARTTWKRVASYHSQFRRGRQKIDKNKIKKRGR